MYISESYTSSGRIPKVAIFENVAYNDWQNLFLALQILLMQWESKEKKACLTINTHGKG